MTVDVSVLTTTSRFLDKNEVTSRRVHNISWPSYERTSAFRSFSHPMKKNAIRGPQGFFTVPLLKPWLTSFSDKMFVCKRCIVTAFQVPLTCENLSGTDVPLGIPGHINRELIMSENPERPLS